MLISDSTVRFFTHHEFLKDRIFYKSCGVYNVVKGSIPLYNVTFDWENRVDVEDIAPQTKAYVRLVKIE